MSENKKDYAKILAGAPLAAVGGFAAFRGRHMLKAPFSKTDKDWVKNYLKFSDSMLTKSYPGRKAKSYQQKYLDGKQDQITKGEKIFNALLLRGKPKNDFLPKHYTAFGGGHQKAIDFWGDKELRYHLIKKVRDKNDPMTMDKMKDITDGFKSIQSKMKNSKDPIKALDNIKGKKENMAFKELRNEKSGPWKDLPPSKLYPTAVAALSSAGLGGAALIADSAHGLRKTGAKKDDDKVSGKTKAMGAAAASAAAFPAAREYTVNRHAPKLNPNANKLVIVTEGGKYNPGGGGHAAVAKSVAKEYEKKYGKGSTKILNMTDYSKIRSEKLTAANKKSYLNMTSSDSSKLKKSWNKLRYAVGFGPQRFVGHKRMAKEFDGASSVLYTQPDAANFAKKVGVTGDLVATDYGLEKGNSKYFWDSYGGLAPVGKDRNRVTKVFSTTKDNDKFFKSLGSKTKRIASVPLDPDFLEQNVKASPKSSKASPKQKIVELYDNKGNLQKNKVKLDKAKKTVLVMGGTTGQDVEKITSQIPKDKYNVIGISGKNEKVRKAMEAQGGVIAQGFDKNMMKRIDDADIILGRPHGISSTEVLGKGKPLISVTTHKGKDTYAPHMSGNAEHFSRMQKGAPIGVINEEGNIAKSLEEVEKNYGKYKANAEKAQKQISRNAAKQVVDNLSKTTNRKYKLMKATKGISYGAALGLGTAAAINHFSEKPKSKK